MEHAQALTIVRSLANGVGPASGEGFAATQALEKAESFERRRQQLPTKPSAPWSKDEYRKPLASFKAGRGG